MGLAPPSFNLRYMYTFGKEIWAKYSLEKSSFFYLSTCRYDMGNTGKCTVYETLT